MGCDIHVMVESRYAHNRKPEGVASSTPWGYAHLGEVGLPRDYLLFERMAGVRGDEKRAIAPLRGIPADASLDTKRELGGNDDLHSHSWISEDEFQRIYWELGDRESVQALRALIAYERAWVGPDGDVRIIFAFDN
jgi:hypothetical protein